MRLIPTVASIASLFALRHVTVASFLGRYPYGGSARVMQYVAPSIIILAGLGVAASLGGISRPRRRVRAAGLVLSGLAATGLGMIAWDVTHPFKEATDEASRDFARRFWVEASPCGSRSARGAFRA